MMKKAACLISLLLLVSCSHQARDPGRGPSARSMRSSYFHYSSDTPLSVAGLRRMLEDPRFPSGVSVGIDSGGDIYSEEFRSQVRGYLGADKGRGKVRMHVGLTGPGGPTGNSGWLPEECEEVKNAARSVGITDVGDLKENDCDAVSSQPGSWMQRWNASGYLRYHHGLILELQKLGVDSVEIGNLYRAGVEGPERFVQFFRDYQAWADANQVSIRILMKNVTVSELQAIGREISAGKLRRDLFSDFFIVEEETGVDWDEIAELAKRLGFVASFSWDTYYYHSETDDQGTDLVFSGPKQEERRARARR